jgi:hypothetical protein
MGRPAAFFTEVGSKLTLAIWFRIRRRGKGRRRYPRAGGSAVFGYRGEAGGQMQHGGISWQRPALLHSGRFAT